MQIKRRGIHISKSGKFIKKQIDLSSSIEEQKQKTTEMLNEISFYKANSELFLSDVFKYSSNSNSPFIVFKKRGTSLIKFLKLKIKNRPETLTKICFKIIDFYTHLHKKGYLHYDISPEHIYIFKSRVYTIDFGFAYKRNTSNPNYKGGFVHFISPRVAAQMINKFDSQIAYTIDDELFALGLTLYYFLYKKTYIDIVNNSLKDLSLNEKLIIMSKFNINDLHFDQKYKLINEIIAKYVTLKQYE